MTAVNIPINDATELTPSDDAASVTASTPLFLISCSAEGDVTVVLASGTEMVLTVNYGCSFIPLSVARVKSSGTTATAKYYNLKAR